MAQVLAIDRAALAEAARDLRHLLHRGYPRGRALELVGDRYALEATTRQVLHRGVHAPEAAARRRAKLLPLSALAGQAVAVDGHNQLIALEAALKGLPLVLGDDGALRDIQGLGPRHRPDAFTRRAAELLCAALAGASSALILLDAPLSRSGELAAELREVMSGLGVTGQARAVPVPEKELLLHPGPVASSDGELLDAVASPLDLAGHIIMNLRPRPLIISLDEEETQRDDDNPV